MRNNFRELKITNSMTHQKEKFIPQVGRDVKFYSCGPTTYDFLHVGNARALVVGDLLNRILRVLGYKVTFVRNYTDIDDKIIQRAQEQGRDPIEHAQLFIDECEQDMMSLGLIRPDFTPKVSETIPEIILLIEKLFTAGSAYEVNGEVLYHVPSFKTYGKLSKKDLESLQHGIRVQVNEHKKNPADFVLWKPSKEGEPSWESPWGKGRPGWHIECSAMAYKYLGESIDLHHGGIDLIFPHHENEIAQSEMSHGKEFCHYWCHNEFLNFGSEKMSKSLGNVVTIRKFVETYSGEVLRHILLSSHYRTRLDWTQEMINQAIYEVERIHQFVLDIRKYCESKQIKLNQQNDQDQDQDQVETQKLQQFQESIKDELANDFNVPGAMAHFYTFLRQIRRDYLTGELLKERTISFPMMRAINETLQLVQDALGCIHDHPEEVLERINLMRKKLSGHDSQGITEENIKTMIEQRIEAKKDKSWAEADKIRNELKGIGIILLDHPDGTTTWKYE